MTSKMKYRTRPQGGGPAQGIRVKIQSVEELSAIAEEARKAGNTVVFAHGVFDLVHMGHVRHLEAARREGDVLIVTVTADAFVSRGPGRPIFSDAMRAEMLAAIEYVDWVGVNHSPSAEDIINAIRPGVYVKGSDYEDPEDDVTGKIVGEREAVERHGGRIVFTKNITFSSSSLINQHLDVFDPPLRDYLDGLRNSGAVGRIIEFIESVKDYRVLIVGDAIIDEYQYIEPMGKSPKENMIATRFRDRELFAGGVFAAANHVAGFCKEVEVITALGTVDSHEGLVLESLKPNVKLTALHRKGVPTTRKCRFIEPGHMRKLFEVYFMDDTPLDGALEQKFVATIGERIGDYDLVIATDFGHGLISPAAIDLLGDKARFLAVNTQTNSANLGYNLITKYKRSDYVCVDTPEAQLAVGDRFSEVETLVAEKLPKKINCDKFIVTHGHRGCVTYEKGGEPIHIPAFTKMVVDTVGAGDAFLAITAPIVAAGAPAEVAGFIGNAAGAIKVGIVGHRRSIEKVPLIKYVTTLLS